MGFGRYAKRSLVTGLCTISIVLVQYALPRSALFSVAFAQQVLAQQIAVIPTELPKNLATVLPQIDPAPVIFELSPERKVSTIAILPLPEAVTLIQPGSAQPGSADPGGLVSGEAVTGLDKSILKNDNIPEESRVVESEQKPVALMAEPPVFEPVPALVPMQPVSLPSVLPIPSIAPSIALALQARRNSKTAQDELLLTYYAARQNEPLWIGPDGYNERAKTVLEALTLAGADGLRPQDYTVSAHVKAGFSDKDDANKVEAELVLTSAVIRYARDARGARIHPKRISALITAEPTLPQPEEVLGALAIAENAGKALELFNPQQDGYQALRSKLAELRSKPGSPVSLEAEIIANMERWRWLPRDLGLSYILVNIPEYELRVFRDGKIVHQTHVIVGKRETPTPIFSGQMDHLIVNPYWNIPPSIALKEMLPQLQRDPYALQRKGFEVVKGGKVVDPASIDWSSGVRNVGIRQPPGERNALGFIKFMFPNQHAVYLHDTPSRRLFANASRAYSHGCVRVMEPFKLAEIVLSAETGMSEKRLRSMIGGPERYLNLKNTLPVHIGYFTAFVDDAGQLQARPDIYGHSRKVRLALGL